MKYNLNKIAAIGAICLASYTSGCNTFVRTGEGFARLGERVYTGIKEDFNSVFSNYKKEPYSLGNAEIQPEENLKEQGKEESRSKKSSELEEMGN